MLRRPGPEYTHAAEVGRFPQAQAAGQPARDGEAGEGVRAPDHADEQGHFPAAQVDTQLASVAAGRLASNFCQLHLIAWRPRAEPQVVAVILQCVASPQSVPGGLFIKTRSRPTVNL